MKYENEMFQDLMGIVIETDDVWLNKKLNNHVCYKGGGGRQTTSAAPQIPEEFKPFAKQYANMLSGAIRSGDVFGQVAETDPNVLAARESALGRMGEVRDIGQAGLKAQQEALTGTGMFAARDLSGQQDALAAQARRKLGENIAQQRAGSAMGRGVLGSARQQLGEAKAREATAENLATKFAEMDAQDLAARRSASAAARGETGAMQKSAMADIGIQRGVGKESQADAQRMLDAQYTGLKQMAGLFTGIPMGQQQTTSQSGGK